MCLEKSCDTVALVGRDGGENLGSAVEVTAQDGGLVLDDREGEGEGEEVDVFVAEVDAVVGREVSEEVHLSIKWTASASVAREQDTLRTYQSE